MMTEGECYGKLIGAALMASLLQLKDSMKHMTEDAGKMLGKHPDSDVCKAVDGIIMRYQTQYEGICKEALDDLGKIMLDDDILTVKEIPTEAEGEE